MENIPWKVYDNSLSTFCVFCSTCRMAEKLHSKLPTASITNVLLIKLIERILAFDFFYIFAANRQQLILVYVPSREEKNLSNLIVSSIQRGKIVPCMYRWQWVRDSEREREKVSWEALSEITISAQRDHNIELLFGWLGSTITSIMSINKSELFHVWFLALTSNTHKFNFNK